MKDVYGYVYLTTDLTNGKIYVGQHRLKKKDIKYYGSGRKIREEIKLKGVNQFKNEIIEYCSSKEELKQKEDFYIKKYKSYDDEIGYNIYAPGGTEEDLAYIKQFREISIKNICSDLKVDYSNVMSGKASAETIHKVRVEIERRLEVLKKSFQ